MTNPAPGAAENLRNLKVPSKMTQSRALVDFLIAQTEAGPPAEPAQQIQALQQVLSKLLTSHLEVVNTLGMMEESLTGLKDTLGKFKRNG